MLINSRINKNNSTMVLYRFIILMDMFSVWAVSLHSFAILFKMINIQLVERTKNINKIKYFLCLCL